MSAPFYEQRVQPTGMPGARTPDVRVSANPDAFGAGRARDMAAFGQQLQQTMEYIQQKRNEAEVQDQMNQLREETHNWMAQVQEKRGEAALYSHEETKKKMDTIIKSRAEQMKNPVQQRMFGQMSEQVRLQAGEAALNHQGRETFRYSVQTAEASAQLAIEGAARNPEAIGDRMAELSEAVFKKAELLGMTADQAELLYKQARTEMHSQVAQVMAANPNGGRAALEHIEKYAEVMDPTVVAKFKAQFKGQADREDAYSTALGLMQNSPNQLAALEEVRKLPPEKAMQVESDLMRLYSNRRQARNEAQAEVQGQLALDLHDMQRNKATWGDVEKKIRGSDLPGGTQAALLTEWGRAFAAQSDRQAKEEQDARRNATEIRLIDEMSNEKDRFMGRDLFLLSPVLGVQGYEKWTKFQESMRAGQTVSLSRVEQVAARYTEGMGTAKKQEFWAYVNDYISPHAGEMDEKMLNRAMAAASVRYENPQGRPSGIPAGMLPGVKYGGRGVIENNEGVVVHTGDYYTRVESTAGGGKATVYYAPGRSIPLTSKALHEEPSFIRRWLTMPEGFSIFTADLMESKRGGHPGDERVRPYTRPDGWDISEAKVHKYRQVDLQEIETVASQQDAPIILRQVEDAKSFMEGLELEYLTYDQLRDVAPDLVHWLPFGDL